MHEIHHMLKICYYLRQNVFEPFYISTFSNQHDIWLGSFNVNLQCYNNVNLPFVISKWFSINAACNFIHKHSFRWGEMSKFCWYQKCKTTKSMIFFQGTILALQSSSACEMNLPDTVEKAINISALSAGVPTGTESASAEDGSESIPVSGQR